MFTAFLAGDGTHAGSSSALSPKKSLHSSLECGGAIGLQDPRTRLNCAQIAELDSFNPVYCIPGSSTSDIDQVMKGNKS